ncbi:MAG: metallophosphoesterase family protein [Phycisphaerales bacterium JB063]
MPSDVIDPATPEPIPEPELQPLDTAQPEPATRVALIGDLHVYSLWPAPWHMASKRLLGQTNLWLNRRKAFRHHRLHELVDKVVELQPDLALCSGDLTTTALRGEFETARRFLAPVAEAATLLAVPGNHDKYTFTAARTRRMQRLLPGWVPESFPHTQSISPGWDLLALDAAIPRLRDAVGRIGSVQLEAIATALDQRDPARGLVVLCHYPCVVPPDVHEHDSHRLADAAALREMLAKHTQQGARVVYVHGHIHYPWFVEPGSNEDDTGSQTAGDAVAQAGVPFTCINAGAPCMVSPEFPHGQGFGELVLPDNPAGTLIVRRHALD